MFLPEFRELFHRRRPRRWPRCQQLQNQHLYERILSTFVGLIRRSAAFASFLLANGTFPETHEFQLCLRANDEMSPRVKLKTPPPQDDALLAPLLPAALLVATHGGRSQDDAVLLVAESSVRFQASK